MDEIKTIYLDNAATTPVSNEVAEVIKSAMVQGYYNPSALYSPAVQLSTKIKECREIIKGAMHAPEGELYFTSGGTESNNMALFGVRKPKGSRIIVGMGEHDSVNAPANELLSQGYDVRFAPINSHGIVDVEEFKKLLNESVSLVSIMHASNETGGINDIARLVKLTKKVAPKAIFHSDGVQALGKTNVNLSALGVDLYSITAHKLCGPKGVGALFVKKGVSLKPLLFGGGQEKGMRSGTENYPSILGFAEAAKCACETNFEQNYSKFSQIREYLLKKLSNSIENLVVITDMQNSVPNVLTLAIEGVRGEVLLHSLEKHGILIGIGSACSSHHESRFKSLLSLDSAHRDGIVRISFGAQNEISDMDFVAKCIIDEVEILKKYTRQ